MEKREKKTGIFSFSASDDFRVMAVTNRHLSAGDYFQRIKKIAASGVHGIIVREKDLTEREYEKLAGQVMKICESAGIICILHTYTEAAARLGCDRIHLPLQALRRLRQEQAKAKEKKEKDPAAGGEPYSQEASEKSVSCAERILDSFRMIGASVHSPQEAREAEALGADYVTAGHIFVTDCKKGLEPRGLDFLRETVTAVSIPVFAIGGISAENIESVREAGAAGACVMSQMMRGVFYEK